MPEVLKVENLSAGYNGARIIDGLNFTVHSGDVLVVVGPNGSGKTTLLKVLLGILPAALGTVRVFGKERLSAAEAERRMAYIPQRLEVDRTFPITLREMLSLSVRRANVDKYLDMLELRPLLNKLVGDLSGGQMQRALLAYAVIKEPDLLIMDEPTSWIDAKGADCILCIMEELRKRNIAMVVVTHDFSALGSVATHVLGLGLGLGTEGQFFKAVSDPGVEESLASLFGTTHHHGEHGPLVFAHRNCGCNLQQKDSSCD
jgi:ABC-type Mn2+/Zn2+ transport system ATPase subunit